MLLTLAVVELSDVAFAVSVFSPAVVGDLTETFIQGIASVLLVNKFT